jgi:hypothetical protein
LAKLSGQRKRFGTLVQQALISKELSSGHQTRQPLQRSCNLATESASHFKPCRPKLI